jgi:hypothetical protein
VILMDEMKSIYRNFMSYLEHALRQILGNSTDKANLGYFAELDSPSHSQPNVQQYMANEATVLRVVQNPTIP